LAEDDRTGGKKKATKKKGGGCGNLSKISSPRDPENLPQDEVTRGGRADTIPKEKRMRGSASPEQGRKKPRLAVLPDLWGRGR